MHEFVPHSDKQERALFSDKKILALLTGIQFGKTTVGALRMKMKMHQFTDKKDAFIITAPTYKIMQQSTLKEFLKVMDGCGEYNKVDAVFKMNGGGMCYLRTGTEADSIVGITNVRHIWGDEAWKYSLYFWENIQARSALMNCGIDLTSSPYAMNWLFKQIVKPKLRNDKARPDVELVQAASWDNPHFSKEYLQQARETMDQRRFNALFGGLWEKMAGLVYDCFDDDENQCDSFKLPVGTKFYGGIDWGYTEPFVFVIRAVTPNGNQYGISEFYRSGLTIDDIVRVLKQKAEIFPLGSIFCGTDQPGYIEILNRNGLRALPANNDVRLGIDRHYELLKTRRLKYFRDFNPHTLDELDTYHYPDVDDVGPDQNVKEAKPVQQNDHALDANRYASIMIADYGQTKKPFVAENVAKQLNHHQETEKLKRRVPKNHHTESWE